MKKTYITIGRNSINMAQVIVDLLLNSGTRMLTVDFTKKDGSLRTINGMLVRRAGKMNFNPFERGLIPVVENLYSRYRNGQCKTYNKQLRMIDLKTVNRVAFNKKVINIVPVIA